MKKNLWSFCKGIFTFALMFLSVFGWGQNIIWNFNTANPSTNSTSNLTISAVSQGNNNGATTMLSSGSPSSYVGASGGNNAGASARIGTLSTAANGSAFFEFTLTAASGYKFTLNGISLGSRETGTGPKAYALRSSADSYTSSLATNTLPASSTWFLYSNSGLSVASTDGGTITFRIYGYAGTGSPSAGTANWRIDDLGLTVTVTPTTSAPTLTTTSATSITSTGAISGGNVTADGGATVSARGVYFATTATPTTGTSDGTGTGSFPSTLSSLNANTQYFYRAYAINSAGTGYGVESSFYTLANIPTAPVVGSPTETTLTVSVGSGDSNPANTEYAIELGGQFVQANGSLGGTAVWQTASTWGAKVVAGLTSSTTYGFQVKARNGSSVETSYSSPASGTTLANQAVTYANIQFPTTANIAQGETVNVYAQAYKAGLTEAGGQASGLTAWVGYSSIDSNPNGTGWTWIPATFNVQAGNNDEFVAALGAGLTPGTYYYASRFQIGSGTYVYGGTGGNWSNNSGVLTVNSNVVTYANIQSPFTGTIVQGAAFDVYTRTYKAGLTEAAGANSNITSWIGYSTSNATTATDFENASWTWVPATYNTQSGNDDEYVANIGTSLAAGTYYYVSRYRVTGSTEYRYGGTNNNFWAAPANSGVLTVQTPREINVKQAATNIASGGSYAFANQTSGTSSGAVSFSIENTGDQPLDVSAITVSGTNASEFSVVSSAPLTVNKGTPGTFTVTFSPTSIGAKSAKITIVNNDADESAYEINLTGTGTNNATTDITAASSFTHPTNIPYANHQATDIDGTTGGDIEIARFTIRDGGASGDADNLPTIINSLSFNLTNSTNIRRVALYDGATEIGTEQAASATHTFSGLNLTAPDNGTKEFSVRVSFKNTVTDNQQIQVQINAATAVATGSGLTTFLGANSSIAGDNNRIEVLADRLSFTTQPIDGGVNVNLTPFAVSAVDANAMVDLDATNSITLSTTGTGMTSSASYSMVSGVATISNVQYNAIQTGITITATTTGLAVSNTATSNPFNIEQDAALVGDYRTIADGDWNNNAIWQIKSASGWTTTTYPFAGTGTTLSGTIYINNIVRFNVAFLAVYTNVVVKSGAQLTSNISGGTFQIASGGKLLIKNGGKYYNTTITRIVSGATLEVENGAYFYNSYQSGSNGLAPNLFAGIEIFHPESNFVIINAPETDSGYRSLITDFSVLTPYDDGNGNIGYFGNIIYESVGNSVNLVYGKGGTTTAVSTNYNIANGNIIFESGTAGTSLINVNNADTVSTASTQTRPYKIGGSLIIKNTFTGPVRLRNNSTASVNTYFKIGKNVEIQAGATFNIVNAGNSSARTLNLYIDGDMKVEGNFVFHPASNNTGTIGLFLSGDLEVASGASFTNLDTNSLAGASNASIYFVGLGDGLTDGTTQTVNIAPSVSKVDFNLKHATYGGVPYVKLIKDLYLGTNSTVNVRTNATLDFGFSGNTALNILTIGNGQSFSAATGSTLKVTSPYGLTKTAASAIAGNIQVPVGARTLDAGATYHYIGKENQATGDGLPALGFDLPATGAGRVIVDLQTDATNENLSFSASKIIKFNNTGTLEIRRGKVIDEPGKGYRNGDVLDDDTGGTDSQQGKISMTGGRYVVSGFGTKPSLSGAYTFSAGTVEFTGSAATKIRASAAREYYNIDVSGTNVEAGGKNFTVNNLLKVTEASAVLKIPEITTDSDTPYVVTAKKGIQILNDGKAIFGNNANLLQDVDAANTGNITMLRNATVPNVQFNFWSSPVKDQTLYSLYTGVPLVMEYNSANDLFKTLPSASNPKSVFGKGYSIQGPSSSITAPYLITAKFEGVPNNESSAVGSNTVTLSTAGYNYNLIGNPFPSNLNLVELYNANVSQFYNDGTSATPTAFLWDNTGNTQMTQLGSAYSGYALNNYATVNLSSGIGTPASILGSSGKKPNGIIRPGQGFIMRASETATGLVFKNNLMRTSAIVNNGTNSQYFKNNSTEANDHFWLKLSTSRNVNIVIALSYNRDATNAFERFDSAVLNEGVTENFYSLSSDSKKLAIQTRKGDLDPQDVIPLVIKISENGDQKISIDDKTGIFKENQNIYLKDKLMNKTVNLSNGDYTFSAAKGTDATRFEIVFKDDLVLGTDASSKSDLNVYRDGSDYVVRSSKILGNVEVYDAAGRLVRSLKSTQKNVRLDGATLNEGLYIIRAENSGDIRTKKILK